MVTVTFTVPVPAGEVAVTSVADIPFTLVAEAVPKCTAVGLLKLVPVMVTEVPPDVGPEVGLMEVVVGAGVDGIDTVVRITMSLKVYPTASQKVAEAHDTPKGSYTLKGRVWFVQVVPFHVSALPLPSTASQEVAETHDTPKRLFIPEGMVWFVQVVPFHESAAPPKELYSTASQKVAETHDTPLRAPTFEGRVWFVQVVPFHESATPPVLT